MPSPLATTLLPVLCLQVLSQVLTWRCGGGAWRRYLCRSLEMVPGAGQTRCGARAKGPRTVGHHRGCNRGSSAVRHAASVACPFSSTPTANGTHQTPRSHAQRKAKAKGPRNHTYIFLLGFPFTGTSAAHFLLATSPLVSTVAHAGTLSEKKDGWRLTLPPKAGLVSTS